MNQIGYINFSMKSLDVYENEIFGDNDFAKPEIRTDLQPFWLAVFDFSFNNMVKKAFYSVKIKNIDNFYLRDTTKSSIFYSNHCCWWDGIVGYLIARKLYNTELHMMIEELYRFPLLSKIGAFSVEKNSAQSSLKALNYAAQFLQNPKSSLWIFPQGSVMPPDYRPVKFEGGLSYLSKKLKKINLIPVAHRYNFLREDRPEILVEIGKPIVLSDNPINRKNFCKYLEEEFSALLDNQKNEISQGNLDGYKTFIKSRLCVAKLIEKYFTQFVRSV